MSAFLAIVRRELSSVLRDRTMLIAILIQLFIASFSSALLIGMLSLYDAESVGMYGSVNLDVGLVGGDSEPLTGLLRERGVRVKPYATLAEAQAGFSTGKVRAILAVTPDSAGTAQLKLYLPRAESTSAVILMVLQEPLKRYENAIRLERGVDVRYTDLKGKPPTAFEFIYSVILPMLMFFPAFVAGGMVIDALTEEVENSTLPTLLSTPITVNGIVGAKIAAALLLAALQCAAWLGLLRLNRIEVHNVGWVLLLAVLIAGLAAAGAGLTAALFRDRERSQFVFSLALLAATSLSLVFNISPVKAISRLAVGDALSGGWDVAVFVLLLGLLLAAGSRLTGKLKE